jgi:ferrous-iron efflux pump FieF
VVVAIVLSTRLGWYEADPIIALLVALVLVVSAWSVFRQSFDQLMDRELPDEARSRIVDIVRSHEDVSALHELKTRQAGGAVFIQVHLELDPQMSLARAHAISDQVEQAICAAFPRAEVIIHQDPAGAEPATDRVTT